jgi:hypothetical protein
VGSGGDAHGDARNQAASREGERGNWSGCVKFCVLGSCILVHCLGVGR